MSFSQVHASISPSSELHESPNETISNQQNINPIRPAEESGAVDYSSRAQWLRAALLGANDGLVSVASIMIGVGAVNQTARAMLVSGFAGLVAGACSMAIGEFVSVYAQYDIEMADLKRKKGADAEGGQGDIMDEEKSSLPSPWRAAAASAVAFAVGALLPLLAGGLVKSWGLRIGLVCAVSSVGLAGFGAVGAALGGAKVAKSAVRVLVGGLVAMGVSYGVLRLFGIAFKTQVSSS